MNDLAGHTDIDTVRDATDLVRLIGEHVALRPKGREHVGLCPFHNDKNPSFCVVTHKGNAFYKCHACGAGGDAFDFVMNYHRMDFGEALRLLADRAGVKLQPRAHKDKSTGSETGSSKRADLRKANAFAATFFQRILNDQAAGATAREVIVKRGINEEMVQAFMIGAAPNQWDALANLIRRKTLSEGLFISAGLLKPRKESEGHYDTFRNRLIFPICDDAGLAIAFGARKIDPNDEPKYLNSAESDLFSKSKTLYGMHRAKRAIIDARCAIVTEGYTDVIACHQAGFCNVVGTLGTALTHDHARILSRLCDKVLLVFDGDDAGQRAADRGVEVLFTEQIDVKICVLPDELDPDELLKKPDGPAIFTRALADSIDALEYKLRRFQDRFGADDGVSVREKKLTAFLSELANLGFTTLQGVKKRLVLAQLSDLFGVPISIIETAIPKSSRSTTAVASQVAEHTENPARSMVTNDVQESGATPGRRMAEEQVLALVIYQPDLADYAVNLKDESSATYVDLVKSGAFSTPCAAMIARAIFDLVGTGTPVTVPRILATLDDPAAHRLASNLYFEGQRHIELSRVEPRQYYSDAVRSLQSHIGFCALQQTIDEYQLCKNASDQAIVAARSIIERRRQHGHVPAAIGRGLRT